MSQSGVPGVQGLGPLLSLKAVWAKTSVSWFGRKGDKDTKAWTKLEYIVEFTV